MIRPYIRAEKWDGVLVGGARPRMKLEKGWLYDIAIPFPASSSIVRNLWPAVQKKKPTWLDFATSHDVDVRVQYGSSL